MNTKQKNQYNDLKDKTTAEIMLIVFLLLDERSAFGSQKNSNAAKQSIEQLIKDKSNETK